LSHYQLIGKIYDILYRTMDIGSKNEIKKKRKLTNIENQVRDGIISPPKLISQINPVSGELQFMVPSKSSSDDHTVTIGTADCLMMTDWTIDEIVGQNNQMKIPNVITKNKISYRCDCHNNKHLNEICKHIRTVMIFMLTDMIEQHKMSITSDSDETDDILKQFSNIRL
jgi:hypothetical protein